MHKYTKITLAFVIFALSGVGASAGQLTGQVLDRETGSPIWGVNVRVVELELIIETTKKGQFEFEEIPDGEYQLVATHVAYDGSDTLRVAVSGETELEIRLVPMPWVLDDIVVTGTRSPHLLKNVPVQTEVITKRDFERTGATTVDEALGSAIGVTINDDLSGKGATIRGVMGDRVLVMIDGERAVGRISGSLDLGQFSLANVQKIEVVKGTGSTLYGSDAMGGVVNIITNKTGRDTQTMSGQVEYGAHQTMRPSAIYEYGDDALRFNLGLNYYHTDGFDLIDSTPHTNGLDEIDRFNIDGKLSYQLSDKWRATASTRLMFEEKKWIETESRPGTDYEWIYDDDESNQRSDGSVTFDYLSGDEYSMKLRAYGSLYNHEWNKIERSFGKPEDTSITEDQFWEVAYSSNYVIGQGHVATYGFDYNYQDLTSPDTTELSNEKEANHTYDGYFQYEYSPHRKWTFLPGVRYEHHSSFGGKTNPSINIMFKPSERIKFRGFVGQGFRAPSIKQQYFTFDHSSAGYIVYGGRVDLPDNVVLLPGTTFNPLKDETSLNASISAELSYGTIGLHRITYFYNHLDDLIEYMMVGLSSKYNRGIYVYQNVDRALTQGVEWESRVRLSPSVDFSFSYDYLYNLIFDNDYWLHGPVYIEDSVFILEDDSTWVNLGDKLANRPSHTFKFQLSGLHEASGFGASFWGTYTSNKLWRARTNTGGNEGALYEYAPHRTTLNVNLYKRFALGMEAYVRVENLLNQVNAVHGYWPGRSVYIGFKANTDLNN
jgi:outer membrane receptor for ferrienterochelin and colicins